MFGGKLNLPLMISTTGVRTGGRTALASALPLAVRHTRTENCLRFNARRTKWLIKAVVRSDDPVIVFEHGNNYTRSGEVPLGEYTCDIGETVVERGARTWQSSRRRCNSGTS